MGKATTYRALGQPVPDGTTRDNLARLDGLIAVHQPDRLVFLGDFLHAASARTLPVLQALHEWLERHRKLAITLVRGNHHGRAGDPPPETRIEIADEPWLLGPFACCRHPQTHPTHFVLADHLPPVCHLQGPAHDAMRMSWFLTSSRACRPGIPCSLSTTSLP